MNKLLSYLLLSVAVLVQEQQLLVGSQRPQVCGHHRFRLVAHLSGFDHGLQTQLAGQLGLGLLVRSLAITRQANKPTKH